MGILTDVESFHHAGECFTDQSWSDEERKIPLLREVFQEFANIPINIDIKENDLRLIRQVSALINEYNRAHLTVWGSFNNDICKECYRVVSGHIEKDFTKRKLNFEFISFTESRCSFVLFG